MSARVPSGAALLLIDVINDFDFPAAPHLLKWALPAAERIAALKKRLAAAGVPAIYVNDNFGQWQVDFRQQLQRCRSDGSAGCAVSRLLTPTESDYFVLKPRHSGFYSTSLDVLLSFLKVRHLILTGFATDICVVYTANDAYMRGFGLHVPSDCVAAETGEGNAAALAHMEARLKADVTPSTELRLADPPAA